MPKVTVTSGLVSSVVRTAAILIGVAVLLSLFLIPTSNHSPANPSHLLFHSHRLFENPGRAACGEALVRNPIIPNDRGSNDFEKMWFVRNMTKHAWAGYHRLASGSDELKPLSGKAYNWYDQHSLLSTAIDSLDTLLIMGLTEEYAQAKSEVLSKFNPTFNDEVSVFESTIRVVAGLLSAYELDGDVKLLNAAKWMADRLLPAFETPTGIPLNRVNLKTGVAWDNEFFDRSAGLAEAGTLSLELQYLSDVTGDPKYADRALFAMEQIFAAKRRLPHLYPSVVSAKFLSFENENYGIGAGLDSFYEYLLKMWIATGDPGYWARYEGAITTIKKMIVAVSDDGQNVYIPDFFRNIDVESLSDTDPSAYIKSLGFHHLTCFSGGMLGLGSILNRRGRWPENLNMGKRITETCYRSYQKASSGLGPEVVDGNDLSAVSPSYLQRPETVESIFYMWRLTHDPVYREWGWDIAQNIEKYLKTENGYASLGNVNSVVIGSNGIVHPPTLIDRQESFLIAETLKYLYLLFTDDDVVPLEKYVFNTEGHPLSIRGHGKRKDPTLFVPLHGHALFPGWQRGRVPGTIANTDLALAKKREQLRKEIMEKLIDRRMRQMEENRKNIDYAPLYGSLGQKHLAGKPEAMDSSNGAQLQISRPPGDSGEVIMELRNVSVRIPRKRPQGWIGPFFPSIYDPVGWKLEEQLVDVTNERRRQRAKLNQSDILLKGGPINLDARPRATATPTSTPAPLIQLEDGESRPENAYILDSSQPSDSAAQANSGFYKPMASGDSNLGGPVQVGDKPNDYAVPLGSLPAASGVESSRRPSDDLNAQRDGLIAQNDGPVAQNDDQGDEPVGYAEDTAEDMAEDMADGGGALLAHDDPDEVQTVPEDEIDDSYREIEASDFKQYQNDMGERQSENL